MKVFTFDSGNISIREDKGTERAFSRNAFLFIWRSTSRNQAAQIAREYGKRFDAVQYGDFRPYFPGVMAKAEWDY